MRKGGWVIFKRGKYELKRKGNVITGRKTVKPARRKSKKMCRTRAEAVTNCEENQFPAYMYKDEVV